MSTPPDPEHERSGADPPSPDDRLWRHPSEIGAGVAPPAAWPHVARARRGRRTVLMGALAGACLAGGTVFVAMWAARPSRSTSGSGPAVAVQSIATAASAALPTERLAHDLGPSLASVRAMHDGAWVAGTGIWIDRRGTLLTAAPLVLGATQVVVVGQDDLARNAEVLGTDAATGVTVLAVGRTSGTPLRAPAGPARSGAAVAILGAPTSIAGSPSPDATTALAAVRTSSMRTSLASGVMHDAVQLDRAVPADALGGVVVDAEGRVVAITIATDDASGTSTGSPADWALSAGSELRAHGKVTRAWLGVEAIDVDPATATERAGRGGAQLTSVTPESPAADAGLRAGDVLTSVDGDRVEGATDLVLAMRQRRPGDRITLTLQRAGKRITAEVELAR